DGSPVHGDGIDVAVAVRIPGGGRTGRGVQRRDALARLATGDVEEAARVDRAAADHQRQDVAVGVRVPGGGDASRRVDRGGARAPSAATARTDPVTLGKGPASPPVVVASCTPPPVAGPTCVNDPPR